MVWSGLMLYVNPFTTSKSIQLKLGVICYHNVGAVLVYS